MRSNYTVKVSVGTLQKKNNICLPTERILLSKLQWAKGGTVALQFSATFVARLYYQVDTVYVCAKLNLRVFIAFS